MREKEWSPQSWKMRFLSRLWYVVSKPAGQSASDSIPSHHQIGMEGIGHQGTPQPLDRRNIEVVGDPHDAEGEEEEGGEEVFEYAWSVTEWEDEAARARQYELDLDMGLFGDD